jgi:hypothetical protein
MRACLLALLLTGCATSGTVDMIRAMDATDCQQWRVSVRAERTDVRCDAWAG